MNKRQAKKLAHSLAASALQQAFSRGWTQDELAGNGKGLEVNPRDLKRLNTEFLKLIDHHSKNSQETTNG